MPNPSSWRSTLLILGAFAVGAPCVAQVEPAQEDRAWVAEDVPGSQRHLLEQDLETLRPLLPPGASVQLWVGDLERVLIQQESEVQWELEDPAAWPRPDDVEPGAAVPGTVQGAARVIADWLAESAAAGARRLPPGFRLRSAALLGDEHHVDLALVGGGRLKAGSWRCGGSRFCFAVAVDRGGDGQELWTAGAAVWGLTRRLRSVALSTLGEDAPVEFSGRGDFVLTAAGTPPVSCVAASSPIGAKTPSQTLRAADPTAGQVVADIGCGSGGDARAAARIVGDSGRVYARDVDARALPGLDTLHNVDAKQSQLGDVLIPAGSLDLAWMAEVWHSILRQHDTRDAFVRSLYLAMKPGGVLVIVRYTRARGDELEAFGAEAADVLVAAGFQPGRSWLIRSRTTSSHAQWVMEFRRPPGD